MLNDSYSASVGAFHPQTGDEKNLAIWDSGRSSEFADNPNDQLKKLLQKGSKETPTTFLNEYFSEALSWGDISFVMAFGGKGESVYCA